MYTGYAVVLVLERKKERKRTERENESCESDKERLGEMAEKPQMKKPNTRNDTRTDDTTSVI